MKSCDLAGLRLYTADVTALFTCVNVEIIINDVIEFCQGILGPDRYKWPQTSGSSANIGDSFE